MPVIVASESRNYAGSKEAFDMLTESLFPGWMAQEFRRTGSCAAWVWLSALSCLNTDLAHSSALVAAIPHAVRSQGILASIAPVNEAPNNLFAWRFAGCKLVKPPF